MRRFLGGARIENHSRLMYLLGMYLAFFLDTYQLGLWPKVQEVQKDYWIFS